MQIRWQAIGGDELANALNELSVSLQRKVVREVLTEAGEHIRAEASRRAPHAPGAPDLKENIGISNARTRGTTEVAAVKIGPVKGFAYGLAQELGTYRHGAQPFMRPAFDSKAQATLGEIGQELWRILASRGVHRKASRPVTIGPDSFTDTGAGLGAGSFQYKIRGNRR